MADDVLTRRQALGIATGVLVGGVAAAGCAPLACIEAVGDGNRASLTVVVA